MRPYRVSDWFWYIGADRTQVWSSADARYLTVESQTVVAFLRDGNSPSIVSSIDELAQIFQQQFPAGMLLTYANARQWEKATGGYPVKVGDLDIIMPTTVESMSLISGKVQRLALPNPPVSITWQVGPTELIDIPADDFTSIAIAVADFVQETFDTLKVVFADVDGGTITTIEQIDDRFA